MKKIIVILIVILSTSCQNNKRASLIIDKNISLKVEDDFSDFPMCLNYNSSLNAISYLTFNFLNRKTEIHCFDKKTLKLSKKYSLDSLLGYETPIHGYEILEDNKIFLSGLMNSEAYISDKNFRVEDKFSLNYEDSIRNISIYNFVPCPTGPVLLKNNNLYFSPRINSIKREDFYNKNIFYSYNINNNRYNDLIKFYFPGEYIKSNFFSHEYSSCFNENEIIISPINSHDIWIYNIDNNKYRKVEAKSDNFRKFKNYSEKQKTMQENLYDYCAFSLYTNIIYDKYRKVYYRVFLPGTDIDLNDKNLSFERENPKKIAILIFDDKFNKIGENLFDNYSFLANFFVAPDGLYVNSNNKGSKKFKEGFLNFTKLNLNYD